MMDKLLQLDTTLNDMEVKINSVYSILKLLGSWSCEEPFLDTELSTPVITGCEDLLSGVNEQMEEASTVLTEIIAKHRADQEQPESKQ